MLNKDTIDVLTQINGMTNSIILKYPTTVAVTESQDMQLMIDLSELDPEPFSDIVLKNSLSDLLNLIKLFPDDREITIDTNSINVSGGTASSSFIMDNIVLMDAYNLPTSNFEKTEAIPSVATFDLTPDDIKNIKSSSGVFKDLSEVIFCSRDDEVKVSLGATNKFNAKSNTFSVTKPADTNKEFEVKIPVENFKMIPSSEYTVHIKYNEARDSYRILMCSKSLECLKIMMSVKV